MRTIFMLTLAAFAAMTLAACQPSGGAGLHKSHSKGSHSIGRDD